MVADGIDPANHHVRRKVASGLYNNASEVIREALRLLVRVLREAEAVF